MGYRLHYEKKRIVKYGGGFFKYLDNELAELISDFCPNAYIYEENDCVSPHWEIPRNEFENMVKHIKSEFDKDTILFGDYTVKEFTDSCDKILENTKNESDFSDPEFIYLDWF